MFELCDKAGGYHLKHYSLRQTHPLYWEQSRHAACSRLADSTQSVGSAMDSIDLDQKKRQTEDLPYCSYRAVGHCSSFNFVQMLKNGLLTMEPANVDVHCDTNYRPPHTKPSLRLHRSSQKSTDVPGVSFYAHGLVPPLRSGLSQAASLRVCCHCQIRMVLE